jgi:hypothetical protein
MPPRNIGFQPVWPAALQPAEFGGRGQHVRAPHRLKAYVRLAHTPLRLNGFAPDRIQGIIPGTIWMQKT